MTLLYFRINSRTQILTFDSYQGLMRLNLLQPEVQATMYLQAYT
jgi:hypothetical protein